MIDPRLAAALAEQLASRRATLDAGAQHVGWKLGVGDRERIGGEIAVGHLTSATRLNSGASDVTRDDGTDLRADVELAVELGRRVDPSADSAAARAAISGYGVALEIVDLASFRNERPQAVVAANVFHRAFAFGPMLPKLPGRRLFGTLAVDGEVRGRGRAAVELGGGLAAAARILDAVGERLDEGDVVITGSIAQVAIDAGDEVVAAIEALGEVQLSVV